MSTNPATLRVDAKPIVGVGSQWVIDASGCDIEKLQSLEVVSTICQRVIDSIGLHVIGTPASHRFATPHGVTMLYLLSESHLAVHTYPEHGLATFNFVCCREHADWPWEAELRGALGARDVHVRVMRRGVWSTSPPKTRTSSATGVRETLR